MLKKNISLISACMGVLALFLGLNLPSVSLGSFDFTGNQTALGDLWNKSAKAYPFGFSFMNCLTYGFLLAGIVAVVLSATTRNRLFAAVSAGAFGLAAIFFFCTVGFLQLKGVPSSYKKPFDLGVGSIFAALCSGGAAACSAATFVMGAEAEKGDTERCLLGVVLSIIGYVAWCNFPVLEGVNGSQALGWLVEKINLGNVVMTDEGLIKFYGISVALLWFIFILFTLYRCHNVNQNSSMHNIIEGFSGIAASVIMICCCCKVKGINDDNAEEKIFMLFKGLACFIYVVICSILSHPRFSMKNAKIVTGAEAERIYQMYLNQTRKK